MGVRIGLLSVLLRSFEGKLSSRDRVSVEIKVGSNQALSSYFQGNFASCYTFQPAEEFLLQLNPHATQDTFILFNVLV